MFSFIRSLVFAAVVLVVLSAQTVRADVPEVLVAFTTATQTAASALQIASAALQSQNPPALSNALNVCANALQAAISAYPMVVQILQSGYPVPPPMRCAASAAANILPSVAQGFTQLSHVVSGR